MAVCAEVAKGWVCRTHKEREGEIKNIAMKKEFNIKLNKEQTKHFKSIWWLFSEDIKDRRTGRTTLLAYVYIMKAMDGGKVYIHDHFGHNSVTYSVLAREIDKMIRDNKLPLKMNFNSLTLEKE